MGQRCSFLAGHLSVKGRTLCFRLISFTVFPSVGIPLLFQVVHPDCTDFGIAAQSFDTATVFDTVVGIGLAYGVGFKCSVYLETCFFQTFAPTVFVGVELHFVRAFVFGYRFDTPKVIVGVVAGDGHERSEVNGYVCGLQVIVFAILHHL